MDTDQPLISIEGLSTFYGGIQALHEVSLEIRAGEIVTVLGSNGAGKSTLLRAISGLIPPRAGAIRFLGQQIDRLSPGDRVRLGIAHCPESRRVFPYMSVLENLRLGAYALRLPFKAVDEDVEGIYALFPRLRERAGQLAGTLSGGEQQMLAVGRAMLARPKLLMLDEPSLGLAPLVVRDVFSIIRAINARGTAILLVEQNAYQALRVAERGYVMDTGRIVIAETAASLRDDPKVRAAYLGG